MRAHLYDMPLQSLVNRKLGEKRHLNLEHISTPIDTEEDLIFGDYVQKFGEYDEKYDLPCQRIN